MKLVCDPAAGWGQHTLQLVVQKQVARGAEILLSYGEEFDLPALPAPVLPPKVSRRKKVKDVKPKKEDDDDAEGNGEDVE